MRAPFPPERVIPKDLAAAVATIPYWFVIGGHAVRCFCPYRPTQDVHFGVDTPANLEDMLAQLAIRGKVEVSERSAGTVHLKWQGIDVSIFVLDTLKPHTEARRLTVTGILGTKLHAILDRGTRRDFFDLYVMLQDQGLGLAECLSAMRTLHAEGVPEPLLLRALTFFDDAEREAPLPKEGKDDWATVKDFFLTRVGSLLVPPTQKLTIQANVVDLKPEG
ncbi:MAG: nucleotidyl transferase AbiEii/AbiGii toxin family protein [Fibrobacterota bacterium]|nr:nucleotidyl transferase AbiEii/AbiGii toxin family protein [Fibrobacterota bacterium]